MGLLDRIKNFLWGTAIAAKSLTRPTGFQTTNIGRSFSYYTEDMSTVIEKGYKGNGDVFAIIDKIAKRATEPPIEVYKVKDKQKAKAYFRTKNRRNEEEIRHNRLAIKSSLELVDSSLDPVRFIFNRPNAYQTQKQFMDAVVRWYTLAGDVGFLPVLDSKGIPTSLHVISPYQFQINYTNFREVDSYTLLPTGQVLSKDEFFTLSTFNPSQELFGSINRGLSPLVIGKDSLQASNSNRAATVELQETRGAVGILSLEQDGGGFSDEDMNAEKEQEYVDKVNNKLYGKGAKNRISWFNHKVSYTRLVQTPVEMDLAKISKMTTEEICRLFGFPFILLSTDNSSYNNYSTAVKQMIIDCVLPLQVAILDAIKRFVCQKVGLKAEDYEVRYDTEYYAELKDSMKQTADIIASLHGKGIITQNEFRAMMDYEPIDDPSFNEAYISPNLVKVADLSVDLGVNAPNDGSYQ